MEGKRISHEVGKGSLTHNNRVFSAKNIDPTRTPQNVVLVRIPLEEAYRTLFDGAIERYNKKQSRKCRRMILSISLDTFSTQNPKKLRNPLSEMEQISMERSGMDICSISGAARSGG